MFHRRHTYMKGPLFLAVVVIALVSVTTRIPTWAQDHPATPVPVKMLVTVQGVQGKRMPDLKREDIIVKQGNEHFKVTQWTPATGENGSLALFILIDDGSGNIKKNWGIENGDFESYEEDDQFWPA